MELDLLREIHLILKAYDNICPCNCYLCEEYETIILLPNEDKLISKQFKLGKKFIRHEDGFYYLDMSVDCPHFRREDSRSSCEIYELRPVDCRIFPFYPRFNIDNNTYNVLRSNTYCPVAKEELFSMERDVGKVLDLVNKFASKAWKVTYNRLNHQRLCDNLCIR